MANLIAVKKKIGSLRNTKKITRAMEMVAATKMRRAVAAAVRTRDYAVMASEILGHLAQSGKIDHQYFIQRPIKNELLIVIGSNRGLCGNFNTAVETELRNYIKKNHLKVYAVAVGKKAAISARRLDFELKGVYEDMPDNITLKYIQPIMKAAISGFVQEEYDSVSVVYTRFISSLLQKVRISKVLPITQEIMGNFTDQRIVSSSEFDANSATDKRIVENDGTVSSSEYTFEPERESVIEYAAKMIAESQFYQAFLESLASEHSSRMVTMKNATDTAGGMIDELNLAYNKQRQAAITQEITEISNATLALH